MKTRAFSWILLAAWIISIFTPWFTYNPAIMGYCWGFQFIGWLLIPLGFFGIACILKQPACLHILFSVLGFLSAATLYIIIFGRWQEFRNITAGFHWADGFRTAQPGFWISSILLVMLCIVFHTENLTKRGRR